MASKLQDMVAKAIKGEVKEGLVAAKAVATKAPKASGVVGGGMVMYGDKDQGTLADVGFIVKGLRGGKLEEADMKELNARAKAVGVTGDFAAGLPDGFTGALLEDIKAELNVAKLFKVKGINGGTAHDLIATYGISAYLTAEAATGTDSGEGYITFVATTQRVMSIVRKSYEIMDDSLIDLASEVRMGIVRAIAEAVEETVVNGDIAGTMDDGTAANSAVKVSNGIRKTGLNKATVDFGGADLTEDEWLTKISEMQLAGGLYLDQRAVARGDVALIVDQVTYVKFRNFQSFRTVEVAGSKATLFGAKVQSIFGIPVVVTSQFPVVNADGVVDSDAANNTLSTCIMVNTDTCRISMNGSVLAESDKDISNQTYLYTGSLRYGFSSVYDSTESAPNTIDNARKNVVAGINIKR